MGDLVAIFITLLLLLVAYFTGRAAENGHYRRIRQREQSWLKIPTVTLKTPPADRPIREAKMVQGSVVISVDYFKRFLSSFRMLFGGELGAYASLIDRGRREALLRMKEKCPEADCFISCRLETSTLHSGKGKNIACVEVLAYSTALVFEK